MKKVISKTKLKTDDNVVVVSGADRGRKGKILFIDRPGNRVIIEGINKRNKFIRPSQENPKGGIMNREFPINLTNILYFCEKCKKGVRLGINVVDDKKIRVCKTCGKTLDK